MLYLRLLNRFILISLALIFSGASHAVTVADAATGLTSPEFLVDFGTGLYPGNTVISNQFSSSNVTFGGGTRYFTSGATTPALTAGYLAGNLAQGNPFDILFSIDVTDALFSFRTNTGSSSFTAYLDGVAQSTFSAATNAGASTGKFYGFTGILFDRIMVSAGGSGGDYNFDNLQFNTVSAIPVPAAVWLFGTAPIGLVGFGKRRKAA
jgi:hypothetical protein